MTAQYNNCEQPHITQCISEQNTSLICVNCAALQLMASDEDSISPDLTLTIDKLQKFERSGSDGGDSGSSMRKPVPSTSQESDNVNGK
jgi:hypothetical protein